MKEEESVERSASFHHIMHAMQKVVSAVSAKDGIVATLGNHDTVFMVNPFETMGVCVLAHETQTLERSGETLHITGADDVHYYYTDMVLGVFEAPPDGFLDLTAVPAVAESPRFFVASGLHRHGFRRLGAPEARCWSSAD